MTDEERNGKSPEADSSSTVFISYSHDTPEHKMWVAGVATDLRRSSVDAILDQWRLRPGMDIPWFMERGIRDSNRVLIVCTPQYARKADAGKGGVGYEKMIVTGELYENLGSDKFVPILVQGDEGDALPSFLKGRYYVDFRNADQYAEKMEELLRALLEIPENAEPPLGPNPFQQVPEDDTLFSESLKSEPVDLHRAEALSPEEVYDTCQRLFRRGDAVGWNELVKSVRTPIEESLLRWREHYAERRKTEDVDLYSTVDEGVAVVAPLFALALASVESRQPQFSDQRSVLDELVQIEWPRRGSNLMMVAGMPEALAYLYHYLHGTTCLATDQVGVAIRFATMRVRYASLVAPLWQQRLLVGWPTGFEGNCKKAWGYTTQALDRLPWLSRIFPKPSGYTQALAAYGMVLTAMECADLLSKPEDTEKVFGGQVKVRFYVPPLFAYLPREMLERGFTTAFRDAKVVDRIAETSSIDPQLLRRHWKAWIQTIVKGLPPAAGIWSLGFDDVWVGELP